MNDGKGRVRSELADCYTNNHGSIKATDGKILNHRDASCFFQINKISSSVQICSVQTDHISSAHCNWNMKPREWGKRVINKL